MKILKLKNTHEKVHIGPSILLRDTKKSRVDLREIYREFFENTQDGIFQTSLEGKIITANPGLAKLFGYSSVKQIKKHLNNLATQLYVKPTRRAEFLRVMRKKDTITNFESQVYRRDKSIMWVSENVRSVKDVNGNVLYFEGIMHDITVRKRVEEERATLIREQIAYKEAEKNRELTGILLKLASHLSEALVSRNVADIVISKGITLTGAAAGSVVLLNEGIMQIVQSKGYAKKLIKPWQSFSIDLDTPLTRAVNKKKAQFITSRKEFQQKYPGIVKKVQFTDDATAFAALPLLSKKKALGAIGLSFPKRISLDKNFRTFLIAFAQHVTQALERAELYEAEKHAREEMERSQEKLKFLSESSKMLTRSLEFKKTLANVADTIVPEFADWCTIDILDEHNKLRNIAISHIDSKKLHFAEIYRKKFPTNLSDKTGIAQVLHTGKAELYPRITPAMIEATAKNPEQLRFMKKMNYHSAIIVPITDLKKPIGTISFITTADSKKEYTNEDLLFAEEIAMRASIAIDNARLYEKAQEGIRVRDEFLNIASHELKTPLTSLQLQIQLLLKCTAMSSKNQLPREDLIHVLETSEVQVKRLGKLINNLLDVSKIANKRFELEREKVNLNKLATDVISRFEESIKSSGSEIKFVNGKTVVGKWDKFRLDQVATNLISNAIKYGEGKPITVAVDKDKSNAKFIVKDNGIGIGADDTGRIFNRFERSLQAKKYGGLGLGLYISKQIVRAHGGEIEFKSWPKKGSEFTVTLPLQQE